MRIIGDGVTIGEDCVIADTAVLHGPLAIGDRVQIGEYCVIGTPGEHRGSKGNSPVIMRIGNDTILREHVVVQRGVLLGENSSRQFGTSIGRRCMLMHGVHIAHDCFVDDDVTMAPYVVLGGHTYVQRGTTFGIHAATHQNTTVGYCSMIGMGAVVVRDVNPFAVVVGSPAKSIGVNNRCRTYPTPDELRILNADFERLCART